MFLTFTYWDLNLPAACKRKYFEENYEEFDCNHLDIYHTNLKLIQEEIGSNVHEV